MFILRSSYLRISTSGNTHSLVPTEYIMSFAIFTFSDKLKLSQKILFFCLLISQTPLQAVLRAFPLGNSFLIIHDTHCFWGCKTVGKISFFFPRKQRDFKSASMGSILTEIKWWLFLRYCILFWTPEILLWRIWGRGTVGPQRDPLGKQWHTIIELPYLGRKKIAEKPQHSCSSKLECKREENYSLRVLTVCQAPPNLLVTVILWDMSYFSFI